MNANELERPAGIVARAKVRGAGGDREHAQQNSAADRRADQVTRGRCSRQGPRAQPNRTADVAIQSPLSKRRSSLGGWATSKYDTELYLAMSRVSQPEHVTVKCERALRAALHGGC